MTHFSNLHSSFKELSFFRLHKNSRNGIIQTQSNERIYQHIPAGSIASSVESNANAGVSVTELSQKFAFASLNDWICVLPGTTLTHAN